MGRGLRTLAVTGIAALTAPVTGADAHGETGASRAPALACDGVTVVVDFSALDGAHVPGGTAGDDVVQGALACVAVEHDVTALKVLEATGLEVDGTAQWGDAFVCRVAGRPAVDEDVVLPDGTAVRETCARTPSQAAYWSVWSAAGAADASDASDGTDGTGWTYANVGVMEVVLSPGDALGMSFTVGQEQALPPSVPADVVLGPVPEGWTDLTAGADGPATTDEEEGAAPGSGTAESPAPGRSAGSDEGTGAGPGAVPLVAVGLVVALGVVAVVRGARR